MKIGSVVYLKSNPEVHMTVTALHPIYETVDMLWLVNGDMLSWEHVPIAALCEVK